MLARTRGALALALALFCCRMPSVAAAEPIVLDAPEFLSEPSPAFTEPSPTFTESESRWTARVGTVLLERSRLKSQPLVYNVNSGDTLLNADHYDFPVRGGLDVAALRRGEWCDVDFRYFGIDQWSASQGSQLLPLGSDFPITGLDPTDAPVLINRSTYSTQLQSVELNLRRNVSHRLTLLAGFRYLGLGENFFLTANYGLGLFDIDFHFRTRNHLYGGQIGADYILWDGGGPLRVESALKAGVFGNAASNALSEQAVGLGTFFADSAHRSHTAFVGDLNFTAVYQLNRAWAVRVGYQLLWVAGVGLVADQPSQLNLNTGTLHVDTSGSALFHGAMLGLERSW